MKLILMVVAVILGVAAGAAMAGEAEVPSVAKGAELFASPTLGTSGETCAECHPAGKGIEDLAGMSDDKLAEVVNACISKPLKGKALEKDSVELRSLVLYLKSLGAK